MSFHVPEKYRIKTGRLRSDSTSGNNGAFAFHSPISSREIFVIASDGADWEACGFEGEPWEHVSVHCEEGKRERVPTWLEMCVVKDMFWDDEDVVIQFHPRKSDYVNNHEYTLHLWRPTQTILPLPPALTVGIKGKTHAEIEAELSK